MRTSPAVVAVLLISAACAGTTTPSPGAPSLVPSISTPTFNVPESVAAGRHNCPTAGASWSGETPVGHSLYLPDLMAPSGLRRKAEGLYHVDSQVGDPRGYTDLSEAESAARGSITDEPGYGRVRHVVLVRGGGGTSQFVYKTRRLGTQNQSVTELLEGFDAPCLSPPEDGRIWAYYGLDLDESTRPARLFLYEVKAGQTSFTQLR